MTSRHVTFSLLLLLALAFSQATVLMRPVGSNAPVSSSDPLQFRLEGLTRSPAVEMTTGSLGGWNENDWVPFRLTADNPGGNTLTFDAAINLEYENNGRFGIDGFADCFSGSSADCGSGSTPSLGRSASGTGHMWNLTVGSSEVSPTVGFSAEPGGVQTIRWEVRAVVVAGHSSLVITWAVHLAKGGSTNLACAGGSPLHPCSPADVPQGQGEASWPGRSLQVRAASPSIPGERTVSIDVAQQGQPGCIIATAAYGNELAPPVQFLRNFRDMQVQRTYLGSQFLSAFNAWYYSWAPSVAMQEARSGTLRAGVRVAIIPLIGALFIAQQIFTPLAGLSPELAIVVAGLATSSLIGVAYLTPLACILKRVVRRRFGRKTFLCAAVFAAMLALLGTLTHGTTEIAGNLTAIFVLENLILSPLALTRKLLD